MSVEKPETLELKDTFTTILVGCLTTERRGSVLYINTDSKVSFATKDKAKIQDIINKLNEVMEWLE